MQQKQVSLQECARHILFSYKKGGCQVEGLPGIDYEKVFIYFKHTLYPLFMILVYVGEMDKQCYVNENSLNEK